MLQRLTVVIFADVKREKIDDLLQFIKARLDELEEEKEELKEFQVSLLTFWKVAAAYSCVFRPKTANGGRSSTPSTSVSSRTWARCSTLCVATAHFPSVTY